MSLLISSESDLNRRVVLLYDVMSDTVDLTVFVVAVCNLATHLRGHNLKVARFFVARSFFGLRQAGC